MTNDFKQGDEIILLDGREGIIIETCKTNPYYYHVETTDDEGFLTYFLIYYKDMKHKACS